MNKPDCLSWLLNVRGSELKYSPVLGSAIVKGWKDYNFTEKYTNNVFKNNKNIKIYEFKFLKFFKYSC